MSNFLDQEIAAITEAGGTDQAALQAALDPYSDAWSQKRALAVPALTELSRLSASTSTLPFQGYAGFLIISDSTGREPSETTAWPYLTAQALAAKYQSSAVIAHIWDSTAQQYGPRVNLSPTLTERHLVMRTADGTARTRTTLNSLIAAFTDLDLIVDMAADTWTPAATTSIMGQWGSSGTYGHRLQLLSTGGIRYMWSADGTVQNTANSTAVLGLAPGQRRMIRVTHDVDNGAVGNTVTFYHKAPEDTAWTQLGTPVTAAGVTTINRPSARDFELGGVGGGSTSTANVPGKYFRAIYRTGIDGGFANPQPIETWVGNEDKTTSEGAPTIYVFIGAQAGAGIAPLNTATSGFLDATRFPKMVPSFTGPLTVLLNTGHNEQTDGAAWGGSLDTWLAAMKARLPFASFAVITQNPRTDTIATRHRQRIGASIGWATRNGLSLIDTYSAYLRDARGVAALLQVDGYHPNADGAEVEVVPVAGYFSL